MKQRIWITSISLIPLSWETTINLHINSNPNEEKKQINVKKILVIPNKLLIMWITLFKIALENIITIIYHKNIEVKPNTIHKIRIKYKTHLFHKKKQINVKKILVIPNKLLIMWITLFKKCGNYRKIIEIHIIPKISTNCG